MGVPDAGVVIDLGVVRDAGEHDVDLPPGRVVRWWDRIRPAAVRHWAFAGALLTLVGATMVGSATPPARPADLFSVPVGHRGSFVLGHGLLYVLRVDDNGAALAAYGLGDGARRWETPVPATADPRGHASVTDLGDVLAVTVGGDRPSGNRTRIYDAGTGRALWSREGYVVTAVHSAPLTFSQPLPCPGGTDLCLHDVGFAQDIAGVDRRTGAELWTLRVDERTRYLVPYQWDEAAVPARMALLEPDGGLTVRDLHTGRATGSLRLPPMEQRYAQFTSDQILVQVTDGIRAYDALTLAPQWTIPASVEHGASTCGPRLLCALSPAGTRAFDLSTGRPRWSLDGSIVIGGFDERHLMAYPISEEGQVLAGPGGSFQVVHAETGERLFAPRGWEPLAYPPAPALGLVGRWDRTRSKIWLGELRADAGEVWPLGPALTGMWEMCLATVASGRTLLICQTIQRTVRVLRLPG